MMDESLSNAEWLRTVDRLGGAELLEEEAREFGAFKRARKIECAVDQLRLGRALCLGDTRAAIDGGMGGGDGACLVVERRASQAAAQLGGLARTTGLSIARYGRGRDMHGRSERPTGPPCRRHGGGKGRPE